MRAVSTGAAWPPAALKLHFDAAVDGERRGRGHGARVFKHRRIAPDAYGVASDRVQCADVEVGAEGRIVIVEQVFHQAVNLDVFSDLVAGAQVDHGVAWQRSIVIAFIAAKELARDRNEIATNPPLRRDPVVETKLEAMARNAGNVDRKSVV